MTLHVCITKLKKKKKRPLVSRQPCSMYGGCTKVYMYSCALCMLLQCVCICNTFLPFCKFPTVLFDQTFWKNWLN